MTYMRLTIYYKILFSFSLPLRQWINLATQSFGEAEVSGEELHEILKEIDTNMNGQVELDEYLQVGVPRENSVVSVSVH